MATTAPSEPSIGISGITLMRKGAISNEIIPVTPLAVASTCHVPSASAGKVYCEVAFPPETGRSGSVKTTAPVLSFQTNVTLVEGLPVSAVHVAVTGALGIAGSGNTLVEDPQAYAEAIRQLAKAKVNNISMAFFCIFLLLLSSVSAVDRCSR
jgi:hypothetical protein